MVNDPANDPAAQFGRMGQEFGAGGLSPQGVSVEFGLTESSGQRLRGAIGRFIRVDAEAEMMLNEDLLIFAEALKEEVKRQFILGGHDTRPEVQPPGYRPSIDTIEVTSGPHWARIRMTGGGALVETGWHRYKPIVVSRWSPNATAITGEGLRGMGNAPQIGVFSGAQSLHFKIGGEDVFRHAVYSEAEYAPHPFMEAAMASAELDRSLGRIALMTYSRVFPERAAFWSAPESSPHLTTLTEGAA